MLNTLEPKALWKYFDALCAIPRQSKKELLAVQFIQKTALKLNLKTYVDSAGNILVTKEASPGNTLSPTIILQSHLDMVQQKNSDVVHDFDRDPIQPYIDGDWVKAKDTTLGADNGIGVAATLAILESSNINHGPIEALFTIDEETGMSGAHKLQPALLKGSYLINLDSEDDSEIYIGCAGGMDASAQLISPLEKNDPLKASFQISVRGLRGGHSGVDIHLGRANAIKLLNRILFCLIQKFDIRIGSFTGGSARNAIPREAFASFVIPEAYTTDLKKTIPEIHEEIYQEFGCTDPDLSIDLKNSPAPEFVLTGPAQDNLVRALYACPNGVIKMNSQFPDVVETSNNLAIIDCNNGKSTIHCLLRSSLQSACNDLANAVLSALSLAEAHVEFSGAYPAWQPDRSSKLLKIMQSTYEELFKQNAHINVIHAGLECGIIGAKYPGINMVSIGPTICHPHSPDEKVSIVSVQKFWQFLKACLKNLT